MPDRATLRRSLGRSLGRVLGRIRRREALTLIVIVESADLPRVSGNLSRFRVELTAGDVVMICPVGRTPMPADLRGDSGIGPEGCDSRVLEPAPTWYQAANAAAAATATELLMFIRGSDRLVPGELAAARAAFADGLVGVAAGIRLTGPRTLTGELRYGIGGRLIARDAWESRHSTLADGDDWLLARPVAELGTDPGRPFATSPRVLVEFVHDRRLRGPVADPSPLADLTARTTQFHRLREALGGASAGLEREIATTWLPYLLADAERADHGQWEQLVALAGASRADVAESKLPDTRARVLRWLAAEGRREDTVALAGELFELGADLPTRVAGDQIVADWTTLPADVPATIACLGPAETRLRADIVRFGALPASSNGSPEPTEYADLFVTIGGLDHTAGPLRGQVEPRLSARLPDGTAVAVRAADPADDAAATRWVQRRFQSGAGYRLEWDRRQRSHRWERQIDLTWTVGHLTRTTTVRLPGRTRWPLMAGQRAARVDRVELTDEGLRVVGSGLPEELTLVEAEGAVADRSGRRGPPLSAAVVHHDAGPDGSEVAVAVMPLIAAGGTGGPVPPGRYRLRAGRALLPAGPALRESAPIHQVHSGERPGAGYRLQVDGGGSDRAPVGVWLRPPLRDGELGAYAQRRLQDGYRKSTAPVRADLVYFESYVGRSATDNPLAICRALARARPELTLRWGVSDHGQWVPDCAVPVLRNSAEWYGVLAEAGCLVVNTDPEPWFGKRPGQFLLQCFHGYPAKTMGSAQWRHDELAPPAVRALRRRGVETWDLILSPTPLATQLYREQYGYTGPAIQSGYPRNDALSAPDAGAVRDRVRRDLGIRPDQSAVLYAPTWREHLATRPRAAELTTFLDIDAVGAAWGDSHVILLRGHRFHRAARSVPELLGGRTAPVIDVTGHPEINELILASDAAVLDYSSLRFDYALTGRPMVFLVPDLEEYARDSRGFLLPFTDSAPGPLVSDSAGVADQLGDVVALQAKYADRLTDFNARYNPHEDGAATARAVEVLLRHRAFSDVGVRFDP
ncbi:MAG: CDP-glycerol glycerophosphotransferase family protein [Nocardioides sp.]